MPEKTLEEKVDNDVEHCFKLIVEHARAREKNVVMSATSILRHEIAKRDKALTALEERVEELEKERALNRAVSKIARGRDLEQWEEEIVHEYYERKYSKEAKDGE